MVVVGQSNGAFAAANVSASAAANPVGDAFYDVPHDDFCKNELKKFIQNVTMKKDADLNGIMDKNIKMFLPPATDIDNMMKFYFSQYLNYLISVDPKEFIEKFFHRQMKPNPKTCYLMMAENNILNKDEDALVCKFQRIQENIKNTLKMQHGQGNPNFGLNRSVINFMWYNSSFYIIPKFKNDLKNIRFLNLFGQRDSLTNTVTDIFFHDLEDSDIFYFTKNLKLGDLVFDLRESIQENKKLLSFDVQDAFSSVSHNLIDFTLNFFLLPVDLKDQIKNHLKNFKIIDSKKIIASNKKRIFNRKTKKYEEKIDTYLGKQVHGLPVGGRLSNSIFKLIMNMITHFIIHDIKTNQGLVHEKDYIIRIWVDDFMIHFLDQGINDVNVYLVFGVIEKWFKKFGFSFNQDKMYVHNVECKSNFKDMKTHMTKYLGEERIFDTPPKEDVVSVASSSSDHDTTPGLAPTLAKEQIIEQIMVLLKQLI